MEIPDKCPRCNKKTIAPISDEKYPNRYKCLSCGYCSIPKGIFGNE